MPRLTLAALAAILAFAIWPGALSAQDSDATASDSTPADRAESPDATTADGDGPGAAESGAENDPGTGPQVDDADLGDLVLEDSDLDDQSYETDGDIFVPTQEIPVDQSIPFPTDI